MELIDKRGTINKSTFKRLIKDSGNNSIIIESGSIKVDSTSSKLLLDLFSQDVQNDKDIDVKISFNDTCYVFTGKDFNWFLKADRLKDLSEYAYGYDVFSLDDEQLEEAKKRVEINKISAIKPTKLLDMTKYHVAVASTKDENNITVDDFSGYKIDCIKWLNQQIVKNANLENEVSMLICLDYDSTNRDWKSLKELFDEGKIDIC